MRNNILHIIAEANIWGSQSAFSKLGHFDIQLQILEHQQITAASIKDADILLVRSSTKVNQALLENSSVRFVGTATIGDDHIDKAYLQNKNIHFSSAAGSSTESVVEYMLASFYRLEQLEKLNLNTDTLGIIGVGRIGSLLEKACANAGLKTLLNDPPRQQAEEKNVFHDLSFLLEHADVLTLHTPLIREGLHKTTHLLGDEQLSQFKGRGIINAGRGACLDNKALLDWLNSDKGRFAVLDCWEGEPKVDIELVKHPQLTLATPHIAGHSLDGKAANTLFVYRDLCSYLEVNPTWNIEEHLPSILTDNLKPDLSKQALSHCLYPIENDNKSMKNAALNSAEFTTWFQHYRRNYPVRRSWRKSLAAQSSYDEGQFF